MSQLEVSMPSICVIAAGSTAARRLTEDVSTGRRDLFFRLAVRHSPSTIAEPVTSPFGSIPDEEDQREKLMELPGKKLSPGAKIFWQQHPWRGNVRITRITR